MTGYFTGGATFGEGQETLVSSGGDDLFVAKYLGNGSLAWARGMGGTNSDGGRGLAALDNGSFVLTGWFEKTVAFSLGGENSAALSSKEGSKDIFIARCLP